MEVDRILALLPHRYPFLLVDRVLECTPNERLTALKNVTVNEPFFQGHFPGRKVMPGVLICEALAQASGLLLFYSLTDLADEDKLYYLVGIDRARFKRPVIPGDQLTLEVAFDRQRRGIYRFLGTAAVDGQTVASCEMMTAKMEPRR